MVDNTLQLLRHRLQSGNVDIELRRAEPLPQTAIDPEQLKEALVNIILNSCEAMVDGGTITISEELGVMDQVGRMMVIRVADNGPGVPNPSVTISFPRFSVPRRKGPGLGWPYPGVFWRITEAGSASKSKEGYGAVFSLAVPCKESCPWP